MTEDEFATFLQYVYIHNIYYNIMIIVLVVSTGPTDAYWLRRYTIPINSFSICVSTFAQTHFVGHGCGSVLDAGSGDGEPR